MEERAKSMQSENEKENDGRGIISKTYLLSSALEREYSCVKERKKKKMPKRRNSTQEKKYSSLLVGALLLVVDISIVCTLVLRVTYLQQ